MNLIVYDSTLIFESTAPIMYEQKFLGILFFDVKNKPLYLRSNIFLTINHRLHGKELLAKSACLQVIFSLCTWAFCNGRQLLVFQQIQPCFLFWGLIHVVTAKLLLPYLIFVEG